MWYFDWSEQKNRLLKHDRQISFEMVIAHVMSGGLLDIVEHPNQNRYPHQKMMIVQIEDYAFLVPFVEDEGRLFLKTVIPSRKATKRYLRSRA